MDDDAIKEKVREVRQAVRVLETEIEREDNYKIGAALSDLNRQLRILYELLHIGGEYHG